MVNEPNTRTKIEMAIAFPMMIMSLGLLGGYLLKFQLDWKYVMIILVLMWSSYTSCFRFYEHMKWMDEVESESKLKQK